MKHFESIGNENQIWKQEIRNTRTKELNGINMKHIQNKTEIANLTQMIKKITSQSFTKPEDTKATKKIKGMKP